MKSTVKSYSILLVIALIWVTEVAWVQEHTLAPVFTGYFSWIGKHLIRWGIAFSLISLFLLCLRKGFLFVLMAAHTLFSLTLLTYFDYFGHPLSEQIIFSQSGEGAAYPGYALQLVNLQQLAILLAALALKFLLLRRLDKATLGGRLKKTAAALSVAGCIICFSASLPYLYPFSSVTIYQGWRVYGEVYGYLPSWFINSFFYGSKEEILQKALAATKPISGSRIEGVDAIPYPAKNIVIIQTESLDYALIDAKVKGEDVTPFLNSLIDKSFFYRIKPIHIFGTSSADFAMITGSIPGGDRTPYKVLNFPFKDMHSFPRIAREKGFHSISWHGNMGHYYGRGDSFRQLGFDEVFFAHELVEQSKTIKGLAADHEVFNFALSRMKPEKNLHYFITLTSHGPWTMTPPFKEEIFASPQDIYERYINSIRYVDKCIKDYVSKMEDGTLVFIYGDHSSYLKYAESDADSVPGIVYYKGKNLSPYAKSSFATSHDEALPYAEFVYFVHSYLKNMPEQQKDASGTAAPEVSSEQQN